MAMPQLAPSDVDGFVPYLEEPTADAIAQALDHQGCVIVERALGAPQLEALRASLDPWFAQAACGSGAFFGRRTKRFSGVFAKSRQTAALAGNPAILNAVEQALLGPAAAPHGDCIQLSQTQAIEIAPGEPAQILHRDDSVFPGPKPFELIVNVMWTLDAFTADNGATRLLPGSHRWPRQDFEQYEDGVQDAVAPAGAAIIWLGSLLHGGGANHTAAPRRGLVMSYSLGWLQPAEKLLLSTPPDIARTLPESVQKLIGYQVHRPNLGWVEGRDPMLWLNGEVGALASASDNLTPMQSQMLNDYLAMVGSHGTS